MCTLRRNDLRVLYEELIYMFFTTKQFMWLSRGNRLRVFYEKIVYVVFTRKLLTLLYDELARKYTL